MIGGSSGLPVPIDPHPLLTTTMRATLPLLCSVLLAALPASGDTTVYTDQADFLSALSAAYYEESFEGLEQYTFLDSPLSFSQNGLSYLASVGDGSGFYNVGRLNDVWLSTDFPGQSIVFNFSGGNINAVGGFLFLSDSDGSAVNGTITLTLSDGTTVAATDASEDTGFIGFISTAPLDSLTLTPPDEETWVTANDFIVSQAVPEPTAWTLALAGGLGGAGLLWRRLHRRLL